jgi:hypothetical protein
MTLDTSYYWTVICRSHAFHRRQNLLFGHKIRLGETDPYSPPPALDGHFSIRCSDCGREHSYAPSEVVRVQLEYLEYFVPHPLFL